MSMKNYCLILVAALLFVCPIGAAQVDGQADVATLARENAQLKARIDALERRVSFLQRIVEDMQPKPGEIQIKPIPAEPAPAKPRNWTLPKPEFRVIPAPNNEHPDWKPGEINGVRYYLIPISNDDVK